MFVTSLTVAGDIIMIIPLVAEYVKHPD